MVYMGVEVTTYNGTYGDGVKASVVANGTRTDAPSSSLMGSIVNPKVKTMKGEGVGARSLACNTFGVKGRVGTSGQDSKD